MKLIFPFFLALFTFFTSATAISFAEFRLSDISTVLLFISLFLLKNNNSRENRRLAVILFTLLSSVVLSSAFSTSNVDYDIINSGLKSFLPVVAGILIAIMVTLKFDARLATQYMKFYCQIALTICLTTYLFQLTPLSSNWINAAEPIGRFVGLSQNPNQLALFLLPIPFFSLLCYAKGIISSWSAAGQVILVVLINILVIGKGLFVAWFFSLAFVSLNGWKTFENRKITSIKIVGKWLFIFGSIFASPPMFYLLYTGKIAGGQDGQGSVRLLLWLNGLKAWGDAFLIGHGPGNYSGIEGPYEGIEAHNFLVDWCAAYGVIGAFPLLAVFCIVFHSAWKNCNKLMIAFVIALSVQMAFHFYGRQPVLWIWWILAFKIAQQKFIPRTIVTLSSTSKLLK